MIKNVIFDIGNVLVDFHPIPYFQALLPNSDMNKICPLIFDAVWEKIDEGLYTCEQAKIKHLEKNPQYHMEIEFIYDHWKEMMVLNEDVYTYLMECRQHQYKVFLLSNIGFESHQYLSERYSFFDDADGAVLSYRYHCLKPDLRIYNILLKQYRLTASECVFFDDHEANIQSANILGIKGIRFDDFLQAKKEADLW